MEGIPYQGKDIVNKILVDTFTDKSFSVYGLELPNIKTFLPAELPAVYGSDRLPDMIVRFEDGSIGLVDFESAYKSVNNVKYLSSAARIAEKYFKPDEELKIKVIVIYTCDVQSAPDKFDLEDVTVKIRQAFLSKIDGDAALAAIRGKLDSGASLDNEDLMRLVILPLTKKGTEGKRAMIDEVIETTQRVENEDVVSFILSYMMVAAGNFISDAQAEKIKEVLTMTAVGKLFLDEKEQYGKDCEAKGRADGILEGRALGEASQCVRMVQKRMQTRNMSEQEACADLDIDPGYYIVAQALIASQPDQVAV